jgi:hypothetical protein
VGPIVFDFGKSERQVYPAATAGFIAKFDFQTSLHLNCAIGSWIKVKYLANCLPSAISSSLPQIDWHRIRGAGHALQRDNLNPQR